MKVPIAQEQVDIVSATGAVATPQFSRPPVDAFGANVAESQGKIGAAIQGAGEMLAQHALQQQKDKADRYTVETMDKIKAEVNDTMTNPTMQDVLDAKGNIVGQRQTGFLQRMNADAEGSTMESDKAFGAIAKKYLDESKNNPYVAQQLQGSIIPYMRGMSEQVTTHESKQVRQAYTNTMVKSIGNSIEDAARFVTPDVGKNRFSMERALLAKGGIKEMVTKKVMFNGGSQADVDSEFRKYATDLIERSATNITMAQGPEKGKEQLNFFNKYMDSKTFNEVSTRIDNVAKQQEAKAIKIAQVNVKIKEHELNDLSFRDLLSGARLEEEYKAGNITEAHFNQLKERTNSPVGATGKTDQKVYYDLTQELIKPEVSVSDKIAYLLAQSAAGKLSPNDAIKLYNMHLIPSQKGMDTLKEALHKGGYDAMATAYESNIKALDDKQHWVRTHAKMVMDYFHHTPSPQKEADVSRVLQNVSDTIASKNTPPNEYPAVVSANLASENLKKHPAWMALPEKGRKGTDKFGNKVVVYPDGRVVRAE